MEMDEAIDVVVGRARSHGLVVLAGAGVSAGPPASLPPWKPLNATIVRVLCGKVEALHGRTGWLADVVARVERLRNEDRFPPEYQAQLIHEMCGDRYFHALQSLDVRTINDGHDAIAALAAAGVVRAILTTNFDRLIEQALERRQIPYTSAFDENGFAAMAGSLSRPLDQPHGGIPVIKIHGCVSDHRSMIDTLKQRRLGRSASLRACLDALHVHYWLYAGFSAADIEGDSGYLGLRDGAERAPGALYIAWPGNPPVSEPRLSRGATMLMKAYGERGRVVAAEVTDVIVRMCAALEVEGPSCSDVLVPVGPEYVRAGLERWAGELAPAAAVLCLGAVLEAAGDAEAGVRVIDRFVRHELIGADREGADFRSLQLHYGRMGAALGRFIAVPDMNGAASNASVETVQSLLRLTDSELEFAALGLIACAWLWLGNGRSAQAAALRALWAASAHGMWEPMLALEESDCELPKPRTPEDAVDAWIAAAQVAVVAGEQNVLRLIVDTASAVIELASRAGDPVRAARAASLYLLVMSESKEDLPTLASAFELDLAEAQRVGDGFAQGFCALALGRWHVGVGGLELVAAGREAAQEVATRALQYLEAASAFFQRQGMDPWTCYSLIQQAKALADLHRLDDA